MDIRGGGLLPNDVILEADAALIGDFLAIHLSQQSNSAALWNLQVFVQTAQGEFVLGSFTTTAPTTPLQPAARTVGFAACAGAIGWKVVARSATVGEEADLLLTSSKAGPSQPGVTKNVTFL